MATMAPLTFDLDDLRIKSFDTVERATDGSRGGLLPEGCEETSMCCGQTNDTCSCTDKVTLDSIPCTVPSTWMDETPPG